LLLLYVLYSSPLCAGTLLVREAFLQAESAKSKILAVNLDFRPSATVIEALEASVPLEFTLTQRTPSGSNAHAITLRYAPLLERFELLTENAPSQRSSVRPYRLRAELLDAFSALRVPAAANVTDVRLSLNIGDLPGPLRLPALFNRDWWLDSGWVAICRDCFAEPRGFAPAPAP
jgi:Domain of unknown function (DUF4390)